MSMPFPTGTWVFEVFPVGANTRKNSLNADWGTIQFQVSVAQPQMQLTVNGQSSGFQNVTWTSHDEDEGTITATAKPSPALVFSFPGNLEYSFNEIKITKLTVGTGTHLVAHLHDADLITSGNTSSVFFTGLHISSSLVQPKKSPPNYVDTSTTPLFTIAVTDPTQANGVTVTPLPNTGWMMDGPAVWSPPPTSWPPTISWTMVSTSARRNFTGIVTATFDKTAKVLSYQFAGTYAPGVAGDDSGTWDSTTNTVPIPATTARYA